MKTTKRILSLMLSILLFITLLPDASAFQYTQMIKELSVEGYEITTVAPDTRYISMKASDSAGKQKINAVEFNPQNQYTQLRAGKSQGYVWSTQTVNTIATNMSNANGGDVAVAAINGDFFTFGVGVPHGVFIEDGIILSTPPQYYAAFGLTYDNKPFIVRHGTILDKIFRIDNVLVNVAGINMAHTKNADSLMLYTEEYARGTKTGTETYELRCRITSGEVRHGSTLKFTVEEIKNAVGNTSIGDGYVVLSAQGATSIANLKKLAVGDNLEMTFRFNEFWSNVKFAVGGIEILLQNGEVYSTTDKAKHPRTSIGIRADGTVVMATFDGRQEGAAGMTYESCAKAMRALGCVDALNLDGGGSTTFVLRKPGEMETSIVNSVSGSSPRQVANALVLMNTAPTKEASTLTISPASRLCLMGGTYSFSVKSAYDENYKPRPVPGSVQWSTDVASNTISAQGVLSATTAGKTTVIASASSAKGTVNVEITDKVSAITPNKTEIIAKAGESFELSATATLNGKNVEISSQSLFKWSAPQSLGSFTAPGKFTLSKQAVPGKITISYGNTVATVEVIPETPPVPISGFEDNSVEFTPVSVGTKTEPSAKIDSILKYAHTGNRSLKVYYNFLNTTGSVGSYYMISNDSKNASAFRLQNAPLMLGMMVYGDESGVELRSIIEDSSGTQHTISYGTISHSGWKYMTATLPASLSGQIYVKVPVSLVSNPKKLTQGVLYFDGLTALYTKKTLDTTSPIIAGSYPSNGGSIKEATPTIEFVLSDTSGIDKNSIELYLDGKKCENPSFDSSTGKVSYAVKSALSQSYHSIVLFARDKLGNPIFHERVFEVKS